MIRPQRIFAQCFYGGGVERWRRLNRAWRDGSSPWISRLDRRSDYRQVLMALERNWRWSADHMCFYEERVTAKRASIQRRSRHTARARLIWPRRPNEAYPNGRLWSGPCISQSVAQAASYYNNAVRKNGPAARMIV